MKRIITLFLVFAMLPLSVFAAFENTHQNTGDTLEDIIAIAETQLGYMEGSLEGTVQGSNDCTKYGEWYGMNYNPWCAMFVSWCADQAGIPTTVIPKHASCDVGMQWFLQKGRFYYSPYYGGSYIPKRGDIIYFGLKLNAGGFDSNHVGIVYKVDDTKVHVLEGNSSKKVQTVSYLLNNNDYILGYGVPNYENSQVLPEPGRYITTASVLNFRSEPNTASTVLDKIPYGTEVEVTAVENQKWGKTVYNGKEGWVSLDYCTKGVVVSYDTNGGSSVSSQIKYPAVDLMLTATKPTREGYTFAGWSTEKNGNVVYKAGDMYREDVALTLYAVWQLKTYKVKLDANGGTLDKAELIKEHGKDITLSAVPVREGYRHIGWSSKADGTVEYTDKYTGNKDITLYAVWEKAKSVFYITYNPNGGTNEPAADKLTEGESIKISDKAPKRDGYSFEGWAYAANAKWAEVFAGDIYDRNASVTLYAVWCKATPNLTVSAGAGGRIQRYLSGNTVTLRVIADQGNSISHILVDGKPTALLGDTSEQILTLDTGKHTVKAEFTYNDGLWIDPFDDVSEGAWYYTAIEYCYKSNIMTGVDATHFAPNATLTRGQFVTLLARLHGVEEQEGTLPFTDTAPTHYYYKYLVWAYNNKIVTGTSADKFSPNAHITREQLCVMLYNYEKFKGTVGSFGDMLLLDYTDNTDISAWSREAMAWAVYNKVISGSDSKLLPRNNATRAQAAVIIKNYTS